MTCEVAGSSVVHMCGGVIALIGAWMLGPRIGKYNEDGSPNVIPGHNIPMAVLGTFVESCEAQWLAGQEVALGDYLSAINSQRRVLTTIGLSRVPRDVPTLAEHLARLAALPPSPDEDDVPPEAAVESEPGDTVEAEPAT